MTVRLAALLAAVLSLFAAVSAAIAETAPSGAPPAGHTSTRPLGPALPTEPSSPLAPSHGSMPEVLGVRRDELPSGCTTPGSATVVAQRTVMTALEPIETRAMTPPVMRQVIVHEIGHALGLDHADGRRCSAMSPSVRTDAPCADELHRVSLETVDVRALRAIWAGAPI